MGDGSACGDCMLSVIILARNEASNLRQLLPTLTFADQVLVVDDYSDDDTREICKQFGAKHVLHHVNGDFAAARNFGLQQVGQGWVLFVDADERLDELLISNIKAQISKNDGGGFLIKRTDVFFGRQLHYGETGNTWLVRLARFNAGVWRGKVHEVWEVEPVTKLDGVLLHYSHPSVAQLFTLVRQYALLRARELYEQKKYWSLWEQVAFPLGKFLYTYVYLLGFLDGWRGLVMSAAMAYHSWLVRWYGWDLPWLRLVWWKRVWRYLMVVPIIVLPFGQLLRGSLLGISGIYAHEIFMMLAVGWTALVYGRGRQGNTFAQFRYMTSLLVLSAAFGISFGVSVWWGMPMQGGLQLGRWYLYVLYLLCLLWGVANGLLVSVAGLLHYYGFGLLALGWLQYVLLPDTRLLANIGWDDHYYRMVGSLFDPNFLGLLIVLASIWWYFSYRFVVRAGVLALALGALAATYSRASWLALLVAMVGAAVVKQLRQFGWILGVAGMMGVMVLMLPKPGGAGVSLTREFSIKARWESMRAAIQVMESRPVLGVGFNQYEYFVAQSGKYGVEYHPKSPDNSFLFVGVTTGLLGLIVFLWLIWTWWNVLTEPVYRASLAAIVVHSMINNSFFYTFVLMWWWLLLAHYSQQIISGKS